MPFVILVKIKCFVWKKRSHVKKRELIARPNCWFSVSRHSQQIKIEIKTVQ